MILPQQTQTKSKNSAEAAVLLVNLGTPAAPTAAAVRRYLAEFLGDPRVVELPRWLWWPVLHGIILRTRPRRSARAYASIWTERGSPLRVFSESLAAKLDSDLAAKHAGHVRVALAMTYGEPSIAHVVQQLDRDGVRRLLVLPLYPQYSATSTGAVFDAATRALQGLRWPPELRFINDYHNDDKYISALCASVIEHRRKHGAGQRLLVSFHGIPQRCVRAGDPYLDQCRATAQRLQQGLGLDDAAFGVSFQSRLGREPWLAPYTDKVLKALPAQGIKHLQVLCPGFAVDCLETLEEIAEQNRDLFLAAGGESLEYIPALNDGSAHLSVLDAIVQRHTQGWPEFGVTDETK